MENSDLLRSPLEVDATASAHFTEMAKWAKFLAVVGFIMCGLIAIFGLFFSAFMSFFSTRYSDMNFAGLGGVMAVIYIIVAIVLFVPNFFLFKFATKMKIALQSSDQLSLNESLDQHRRYYKFLGICMIVVLSFYILAFIIGIMGSMFSR